MSKSANARTKLHNEAYLAVLRAIAAGEMDWVRGRVRGGERESGGGGATSRPPWGGLRGGHAHPPLRVGAAGHGPACGEG